MRRDVSAQWSGSLRGYSVVRVASRRSGGSTWVLERATRFGQGGEGEATMAACCCWGGWWDKPNHNKPILLKSTKTNRTGLCLDPIQPLTCVHIIAIPACPSNCSRPTSNKEAPYQSSIGFSELATSRGRGGGQFAP